MFNDQLKIILYAADVQQTTSFWQDLGFVLLSHDEIDGSKVSEVAMTKTSGSRLVIYDKKFIAENAEEATEPSPALIFSSDDVLGLYKELQQKEIQVGDVAQIGEEYVFNFVDLDGNYFVVSGK